MYKFFIRPILYLLAAETAHTLTLSLFKLAPSLFGSLFGKNARNSPVDLFGLNFPNPVGLAAGFDKSAKYYTALGKLGFGFIEIGTVTPQPQEGNPKPRLFRLVQDEALINRMGFNNDGAEKIAARLKNRDPALIVGGNIGRNKSTSNEDAVIDYTICFNILADVVDYITVNVSSPNTPGLRDLQNKEDLLVLLNAIQSINKQRPHRLPILLKISIDLNEGQLDDIIEIVKETGIDGVIATNTSSERQGLSSPAAEVERLGEGGLSGKPLKDRSTQIIKYLKQNGDFPIIGVGGIHSAEDALEKLDAGASLVQIYTGLIYEGPGLVGRIKEAIAKGRD